jgi:hypothetical protein
MSLRIATNTRLVEAVTMQPMWGPGVIWAVLRRPRLWGEALRTLVAVAPRSWWAGRFRLPLPEPEYAAWRRATAYGSATAPMIPGDVVAFLEWRRRFRRSTMGSGVAGG